MSTHHRSDSSDSFRALTKHEKYFLNGGDLFFLAEHVNFRVHRYFFERESPYFQRQLQVPASPGAVQPGTSEGRAIILQEPPEDFAKFLWVFYNPLYSLYNTSVEDWKVILRLAHQWQFGEVKKLVVRELEKLQFSDVDRIATYQNHEVDRGLLIPRYAALCEREQPLTLAEGMQLGMETTLMIARAREYARANPSADGARSPTSAGIREDEMHSLVRLLFDIKPSRPANFDDQGDAKGSGAGAGIHSGGLLPPPPPPKPLNIPTVTPTAIPTDTTAVKATGTPTGAPSQGKPEKGPQVKGKGQQGEKGKSPAHLLTTPTTSVQEPLLVQNPIKAKEEKAKEADESLINLGDSSLSSGSGSHETKDVVVNGFNGDAKLDEPVQNGDAGKTGESEAGKLDDAVLTGKEDEDAGDS